MFVGLWALRVDRALTEAETERMLAALPPERRQRLFRMKRADKRREPLCAYWILRRALQEQYGWTTLPVMAYGPLGKPSFADCPEICFSLSHTNGAVLVGLSDRPIGVDIECIRPVGQALRKRIGGETPEDFFQSWVRREARAKRTGTPVELGPETPLLPEERIAYPKIFPGYAACVASEAPVTEEIRFFRMEQMLEE